MKDVCAVILAAGKGTRMQSALPKILHTIGNKPLVVFSLETLRSLKLSQIITVVKHQAELVVPVVGRLSQVAYQSDDYGTAKAVEAALPSLKKEIKTIMVVNGDDSMFYEAETFKKVVMKHTLEQNTITFITLLKKNPTGFGRIIYDKKGNFQKIIEEKDATPKQKQIKEVNDGVYLLDRAFLEKNIKKLKPSKVTGEYYLTDLINVAIKHNKRVGTYLLKNSSEFFGISTQADVAQANQLYSTTVRN
jgi:bifunctional UDP-N-acetylglucosamine pyrophosphorylase / glucosamine-1-phosphate N-acetyltransferase